MSTPITDPQSLKAFSDRLEACQTPREAAEETIATISATLAVIEARVAAVSRIISS